MFGIQENVLRSLFTQWELLFVLDNGHAESQAEAAYKNYKASSRVVKTSPPTSLGSLVATMGTWFSSNTKLEKCDQKPPKQREKVEQRT